MGSDLLSPGFVGLSVQLFERTLSALGTIGSSHAVPAGESTALDPLARDSSHLSGYLLQLAVDSPKVTALRQKGFIVKLGVVG